jgi:hypothetical protein
MLCVAHSIICLPVKRNTKVSYSIDQKSVGVSIHCKKIGAPLNLKGFPFCQRTILNSVEWIWFCGFFQNFLKFNRDHQISQLWCETILVFCKVRRRFGDYILIVWSFHKASVGVGALQRRGQTELCAVLFSELFHSSSQKRRNFKWF